MHVQQWQHKTPNTKYVPIWLIYQCAFLLQGFAMVQTMTMVKLLRTSLCLAGTQIWPRHPGRLRRSRQLRQPPQPLQLTTAQPQRESRALREVKSKTMSITSVIYSEILVTMMRTRRTRACSASTALTSSCRRPAWGYTRSGAIGHASNQSSQLTLRCREPRTLGGELTIRVI